MSFLGGVSHLRSKLGRSLLKIGHPMRAQAAQAAVVTYSQQSRLVSKLIQWYRRGFDKQMVKQVEADIQH